MHHSVYLENFCHQEYSENIYDRISTIGEVRLLLLYNLQKDGIFKTYHFSCFFTSFYNFVNKYVEAYDNDICQLDVFYGLFI